ncbi:MAG: endo-1,4-beta-xylanase, partial [Bryobacteraceae bacterium]
MRHTTGKRIEIRKLAGWMAVVLAGAMPLAGQTTPTLRQAAAARGIPVGAAAGDGEFSPDWITVTAYANLLSNQYDMLEPGNAMKWWVTQPASPTSFDFTSADTLVAFAQKYGMLVRGHNLCWHSDNPQWLVGLTGTGGYASTATQAQMAALLQNHINTEVTHFAGKVFAWDVVNEAFSDSTPTTLGNSIWYNQPGIGASTGNGAASDTGYIAQAFQWAHQADPNALLFYNDYNIEG